MKRESGKRLQPARHILQDHLAYDGAGGHQLPEIFRQNTAQRAILHHFAVSTADRVPDEDRHLTESVAVHCIRDVSLGAVALLLVHPQLAMEHNPEINRIFARLKERRARWYVQKLHIAKTGQV